jgi:hypothetical protein
MPIAGACVEMSGEMHSITLITDYCAKEQQHFPPTVPLTQIYFPTLSKHIFLTTKICIETYSHSSSKLSQIVSTVIFYFYLTCEIFRYTLQFSGVHSQSNDWYRGPTELVQHFTYRGSSQLLHIELKWFGFIARRSQYFTCSFDFFLPSRHLEEGVWGIRFISF